MTIRQIFYQLLSTPHSCSDNALSKILTKARKDGTISYHNIVDRSRPVYGVNTWDDLQGFLADTPQSFNLNYWVDELTKPVIWTEKDALSSIMNAVARTYQVDVCVTRGYLSYSNKMRWVAPLVLYFGDFDPSGLDMDRDNEEWGRMGKYKRIALTMEQIEEYDLPSVPVKKSDSRAGGYMARYGARCWELDSLPPDVLKALVKDTIEDLFTFDLGAKQREETAIRERLEALFE